MKIVLYFGTFVASFIGQDHDGKWNHLYDWKNPQTYTIEHIAFRHTEALHPSKVRSIKAECTKVFGLDEEMTEASNQWVSYRTQICNGIEITTTDGKKIMVEEKKK